MFTGEREVEGLDWWATWQIRCSQLFFFLQSLFSIIDRQLHTSCHQSHCYLSIIPWYSGSGLCSFGQESHVSLEQWWPLDETHGLYFFEQTKKIRFHTSFLLRVTLLFNRETQAFMRTSNYWEQLSILMYTPNQQMMFWFGGYRRFTLINVACLNPKSWKKIKKIWVLTFYLGWKRLSDFNRETSITWPRIIPQRIELGFFWTIRHFIMVFY